MNDKSFQRKPHYVPPQGNFFAPSVPPLGLTDLRLSPGKYSLGVDSTIPFISLQGGGSSQKIISWGEMIEIPEGQTVTVKNESFMQGDIQINSGWDFAAKPERISVPVTVEDFVEVTEEGTLYGIQSTFPADTRRCRRGYLAAQFYTGAANQFTVRFRGKPQKHSYPGTDSATNEKTYTEIVVFPGATVGGIIPMGFSSNRSGSGLEPMAFTDQVSFAMYRLGIANEPIVNDLFFYILEY